MKARRLLVIGATLATALTLSACTTASAPSGGETTGKLEFRHNKPWDFASFSKVSGKAIDITLKSTQYSGDPYRAFIRQSFRTPESPGLFTWEVGTGLSDLVHEKLIAKTTDIWSNAVSKGWVDKSVRDLFTVDGAQYCTPISVDDWVMFYNKKVFEKYNLSVPTTWDELMDVAATLKDHGETPFWNQTNTWAFVWFQTLLAGSDLKLYKDLMAGKASYTDPGVVKVMDQWLDMQEKGYFNDPGQTDFARDLMSTGDVVMAPEGTWFTADAALAGMKMGTDVDVFTIPAISKSGPTPVATEVVPACVAQSSPQKALGLKYSEWWMSPEGQTPWVAQQGNLPFNPKSEPPTPQMKALSTELGTGDYTNYLRFYEAAPAQIRTVALEQFSAFLVNRGDPMQYLKAIQTEAADYWAGH